jgi:hypothetical protein
MAKTQIRVTKGKLVVKDLGNPSSVKNKPDGDNSPHLLGYLFGRVTDVKQKIVPRVDQRTGEVSTDTFMALTGMFEGRRAEPLDNKDETETVAVRSGTCYLPTGINEMVIEAFKSCGDGEKAQIDFAYKVMTIKAANPVGYSYQFESLHEPAAADDPLESLRQLTYSGHKPHALSKPDAKAA